MNRNRARRRLANLPPGARSDLLQVLTSPSDVRADVIPQPSALSSYGAIVVNIWSRSRRN